MLFLLAYVCDLGIIPADMMIDVSEARIESLVIHRVVNQTSDQSNKFAAEEVSLSPEMKELLMRFFFSSLNPGEIYNFYAGAMDEPESVCSCARTFFNGEAGFLQTSVSLAEILHEVATTPQVKDGDLYVVRFAGCRIDGVEVDTLGLFKSELKETFINLVEDEKGFRIERNEGFSINKMDKGCLICNAEADKGYVLSIFDTTGKGRKAALWIEDYLDARPLRDSKFYTENTVKNVKEFITKELPKKKEVTKDEELAVMDKTMEYFRDKEQFNRKEYEEAVFADDETRQEFSEFLSCRNDGLEDWDKFAISEEGVKKSTKFLKKVIKLDKDFSIYVHGSGNFMQKGFDKEYGLKYYKFLYTEEK